MSESEDELNVPFITHLQSVSSQLHEMYLELQRAGFSSKEALYVIGITVGEGVMSPAYTNYSELEFNEDEYEEDENDLPDDETDLV